MSDEGASLAEQIIEASRRNNHELLEEILETLPTDEERAKLINEATDPIGNTSLHFASLNGWYECLDILLDQEGVEVDPINRLEKETPLHLAVRYSRLEPEHGAFIVETLIEAGADPRKKNKFGEKPITLAEKSNKKLIELLESAEIAATMLPTVNKPNGITTTNGNGTVVEDENDNGSDGSASDSD